MIIVVFIDDYFIVCFGFVQLLGLEFDLQVVVEFGLGCEVLVGLLGCGVQVCICDIFMFDIFGLELLSQLLKGMMMIMFFVYDSFVLVEQVFNVGVCGFFFKCCSLDEFIVVVYMVVMGGCYLMLDIVIKLVFGCQDLLIKCECQVVEKLV